jgi:hypothetical protein
MKGVAVAGLTLDAVGPVAVGEKTRYVVATNGKGVRSNVE